MPDYGRVFEQVMEQRMQELKKEFDSKLYFEEHADEINERIERLAAEKVEPIVREYERLKIDNADLQERIKQLEKENAELKERISKHKIKYTILDITDVQGF